MIDWIETSGGPPLCGETDIAIHWSGIEGSSIGDVRSDYDRACDVLGYVGRITCGSGEVLVLGDEPLRSAFCFMNDTPIIVRWWACVSNEQAETALREVPSQLPPLADSVPFVARVTSLIMFDAAHSGAEPGSTRGVDVPIGEYSVTSENYELPGVFRFLIHRFLRQ